MADMFSKEKHALSDWRPGELPTKPPMQENELLRREFFIEQKEFVMTLRENPRGRFVRIIERNGRRAQSIIIPAPGLHDFQQTVADMVKAEKDIPPKT